MRPEPRDTYTDKRVATQDSAARLSRTPTPPLSIPTREPTPRPSDIDQMIADRIEGHFEKLRRDYPRARVVCEKQVSWEWGTGVCLVRGDHPDGVKNISAWKFTYAPDPSDRNLEKRSFAYSTADQLGALLSCSGGDCDTREMPVAQGVRLVEQAAARWNAE